jgi:hypothetical protein
MASGLQCPGCGHVHPAGLPEIARGDATFRCYGCYRPLSVPEGWRGHPSTRSAVPEQGPMGDAPPGAGTRDARSARLAARRAARAGFGEDPFAGRRAGADAATQMVPTVGASSTDPRWSAAGASGVGAAAAGAQSGSGARAPFGWVPPRRSVRPVPTAIRALVWAVAFGVGLVVTAVVLRTIGLLGVNTAIDIYAGSGLRRFAVLLLMLPLWAVLSATIAHFSLEALARRRSRPAVTDPLAGAPTSR